MGDLLKYTSDNDTIIELLENGIHFSHVLLRNFNIQKGKKFPVIVESENPNVFMLSWGIDPLVKLPTTEKTSAPQLTHIFAPSVEKQEGLKRLILNNRIVIPVNSFVHQNMSGSEINIKHRDNKVLFMAGIWNERSTGQPGFSLLTTEVENGRYPFKRMPVFLEPGISLNQWLNPETKIFQLFDRLTNSTVPLKVKMENDLVNQ